MIEGRFGADPSENYMAVSGPESPDTISLRNWG